ncbi:hypothetical protein HGG71_05625, partial [Rhodobacteraceae bacterium R_SAG2]|nr:hypothetical protein [Rhodobacteraceae bacterium R_SAG2]
MALQQQGGNVYNTSANAYNSAVGATQGAMAQNAMARPMLGGTATATANNANVTNGQAQGYQAFTGVGQPGYEAGNAWGGGYTAATMGPVRDVTAGQLANTDMSQYMNP